MECYERRDVELPTSACKEEADCRRTYHLYHPSIICGNVPDRNDELPDSHPMPTEKLDGGTLPLVFAIHCAGCTAKQMKSLVAHADNSNVVLVIPEGLQRSFNAAHCCGYALEKDVDDVGFFKYIQSTLNDQYSFIQDYSYAVGWSNGGFMAMHAASLFRAISPISGYLPEIDPAVTKGGAFCVDGICVDVPKIGKGIFLHHGLQDTFVRPTGCCNDPDKPKCCCNIAAETCVSVTDVARNWAVEVNGCELVEEGDGDSTGKDKERGEEREGGNGGHKANYEKNLGVVNEKEPGSTGEKKNEEEDDKEKEEAALVSLNPGGTLPGPKFAVSYADENRGIECSTATGTDCKANTTICVHANSAHFNDAPSFGEAFPLAKEVFDFFAKDACEIHAGTWDCTRNMCLCPEDRGGTFCLDNPIITKSAVGISVFPGDDADIHNIDSEVALPKGSRKVTGISLLFLALALSCAIRQRHRKGWKKDDRYSNDVTDEESTELVSSDVLHCP